MANFTDDLFDAFDEEQEESTLVPVIETITPKKEVETEEIAPPGDQVGLVWYFNAGNFVITSENYCKILILILILEILLGTFLGNGFWKLTMMGLPQNKSKPSPSSTTSSKSRFNSDLLTQLTRVPSVSIRHNYCVKTYNFYPTLLLAAVGSSHTFNFSLVGKTAEFYNWYPTFDLHRSL